MLNKNIFVPLLIAGLSIAFIIISILVFVTGGNNAAFIKKKLKLGATILTLTGALSFGIGSSCDFMRRACYAAIAPDSISLNSSEVSADGNVYMDLSEDNVLSGKIYNRSNYRFSFCVTELSNDGFSGIIQSGNITALDGAMNENEEDFEVSINNDLTYDNYKFRLFDASLDKQNEQFNYAHTYNLKITNRKP